MYRVGISPSRVDIDTRWMSLAAFPILLLPIGAPLDVVLSTLL